MSGLRREIHRLCTVGAKGRSDTWLTLPEILTIEGWRQAKLEPVRAMRAEGSVVGVLQSVLDALSAGDSVEHQMSISRTYTLDEAASIFYMQAMWLDGQPTVLDHLVFDPQPQPDQEPLIQAAWEQLPRLQREAVYMYSHEGQTCRQIAKTLNITERDARDRVVKGFSGIREYLRPFEERSTESPHQISNNCPTALLHH